MSVTSSGEAVSLRMLVNDQRKLMSNQISPKAAERSGRSGLLKKALVASEQLIMSINAHNHAHHCECYSSYPTGCFTVTPRYSVSSTASRGETFLHKNTDPSCASRKSSSRTQKFVKAQKRSPLRSGSASPSRHGRAGTLLTAAASHHQLLHFSPCFFSPVGASCLHP